MGRFSLPEQAPKGLDSPVTAAMMKYMARVQTKVFTLTGGRIGSKWRVGAGFRKPVPTLLLEHRGRKSGRLFTTPLLYLRSGDDLVIIASQGGLPKHPQWYFNLLAEPETRVQLKGRRDVPVTARVAPADERRDLWPRLVELYGDFAKYQEWTDREIPVVVLTPR
ncbi:nitroreductase family deazaflavin-dependent oxidoreductase [Amycolatopsis sp. cg13]|uniref:nitroreductase family deazaflavin-dependent oxidoreductase n=1 Tax=Amycolatopsis sp. cg13 TaxID=3238807 RepID=UPI003524FA45